MPKLNTSSRALTLNFDMSQVLLAQITQRDEYLNAVESFCDYSMHRQTRTPKGLIFIEKFGTLCHAANIAFVCLQVNQLRLSSPKYVYIFFCLHSI